MSRFIGRLEFRDLGSGTWLLHTNDGKQLQLAGSISADLDVKQGEVVGRRAPDHGFGMTGAGGVDVESVRLTS